MKSPNVAFLLSFLLPGAGLWYLGKWAWGFANLFAVLGIGVICFWLLPEDVFDNYGHYIALGGAGGSAGLAHALATRLQGKGGSDGKS